MKQVLLDSLEQILHEAQKGKKVEFEKIFKILSGRGYAIFFVFLSFFFCFPITVPLLSVPLGFCLAFLGLRFAFQKRLWWPKKFLKKTISAKVLERVMKKIISFLKRMKKFLPLRPRWTFLVKNIFVRRFLGIFIFFLAIFLMLPIPQTNFLFAFPIFCLGLGLLEDDGLMVGIGVLGGFFSFGLVLFFILLGKETFF